MKLKNIEFLVDGNGQITLGQIGPVRCAAIASDDGNCLASLVKDEKESLGEFLVRLDRAIEDALEREVYVDEINS
jgi:hypothetical protein